VKRYEPFESAMVPMLRPNIDTDQMFPARFLTTTAKDELGKLLFFDLRFDLQGRPNAECVLNQARAKGTCVLLTGPNFGCGSSREHAVWALLQYGFRALVSVSFADIFQANALKNGLLPIVVSAAVHGALSILPESERVRVDLSAQRLSWNGGPGARFPIDAFAKECLLEGRDELEWILSRVGAIDAFEASQVRRRRSSR
jgi:3-isopropylmalate/(R)-2-methylmalate dehydratase small subunit